MPAFHWNGRSLTAAPGDTIAAALWRNGVLQLGVSRKRHRPLGVSGSQLQGALVQVDGRPHVRADETLVTEGMSVRRQNAWPGVHLDLLNVLRWIPAAWVAGGFERTRLFPGGTRRFAIWERLLMYLAGEVPLAPRVQAAAALPGQRLDADTLVVGGGAAGIVAANAAARRGERVVLIARHSIPGETALAFNIACEPLLPAVQVLSDHTVFGVYRRGSVIGAAPMDASKPASVIVTRHLVLAHGKRSCPPLVAGNDLPGVLEAAIAISMARQLGSVMGAIVVVGTDTRNAVAAALRKCGVDVVAVAPLDALHAIEGTTRVRRVRLNDATIDCVGLVHAGPWVTDPGLAFQSAAGGSLRLKAGSELPAHVSVVGAAAAPDELLEVKDPNAIGGVTICPCMDVTVAELMRFMRAGDTHVEVLKRRTSCGMGPCQGFPCWESMRAVLRAVAPGYDTQDRPTHRPPRRGITVEQAAGLDRLIEYDP